jgi:DNA-directed RNA polymerase subunit RPC12/RpoP
MDTLKRLARIQIGSFKEGETILYCSNCDWQADDVQGMVNRCPECSRHGLSYVRMGKDLLDICSADNEKLNIKKEHICQTRCQM